MSLVRWVALVLLALAGVTLSACNGAPRLASEEAPYWEVVVAALSTDLSVGPNRLVLALRARAGRPVAGGPLRLLLSPLSRPQELPLEARALPRPSAVPDVALYTSAVDLPHAGAWRVAVQAPSGRPEAPWQGSAVIEVHAAPATPALGAPAPRVAVAALSTGAPLDALTSLLQPDPALYQHDPAVLVGAGRPVVVTFAAPAFCPADDCAAQVAALAAVHRQFAERIAVRHIDPYPGRTGPPAEPSAVVRAWNLKTQPWTFVLDGKGRVAAKFEGYAGPEELGEAVQRVLDQEKRQPSA